MQVDPIKPTLKAPETMRLKLEYGKLLSSFAFNFNLHRYMMVHWWRCALKGGTVIPTDAIPGRAPGKVSAALLKMA